MQPRRPWQRTLSFGGRLSWAVGLLIALTAVVSVGTAVGDRHLGPLSELAALQPADVWRGQIWRLFTWEFIEASPVGLLFACLTLYWFASSLVDQWGPHRFLAVFFAVMGIAAVGTTLVGLADPEVWAGSYAGGWTMGSALIVAWGLTFPYSVIRLWFFFPIRAEIVAWGTVLLTVLSAAYFGWSGVITELFAEGAMLAWMFRRQLLRSERPGARGNRRTRRPDGADVIQFPN